MALRTKVFLVSGAMLLVLRALMWLLSLVGSSTQDPWWVAFGGAAIVAFFVVLDEVDGMRRTYARELWKVRIEANRDAVEWLKDNAGLNAHLDVALDGWNEGLHALVSAAASKATSALEN